MIRATLALLLSLSPSVARGPATVDWSRRVVRCTASAAPSLRDAAESVVVAQDATERAARQGATQRCLEVLATIVVETGRTVGAALAADEALARSVQRLVSESGRSRPARLFSDGGAAVDLEVPLDGRLTELLLATSPEGPGAPGAGATASRGAASSATGLLLDASGLRPGRALAPRILDARGRVVYGAASLGARARSAGTVAYAADAAAARTLLAARLGPSPLVVRTLRADGADLVVGDADADRIRASGWLSEGRVVVIDPGPPP